MYHPATATARVITTSKITAKPIIMPRAHHRPTSLLTPRRQDEPGHAIANSRINYKSSSRNTKGQHEGTTGAIRTHELDRTMAIPL
jgi:hypothetical protein